MYNVDITDERLIIGLGQGPLKNVDITPNQYYTLINNGYHVIRNYKPTDLHVVHAPREMTLLEGESAKLIERSENIKASHSKMKLITFAIPKEELGKRKYTVAYESSKPDLVTVDEHGMVQAATRLPAGIAASVVKITVTLTIEGIDQPLTDSIEIKVKKNRRSVKPGLTLNVEKKVFSLPHRSLTIKTDLNGDLDNTGHGNIGILVGNPAIAKVVEIEKDKTYRVDTARIEGQTTIRFFYLKAPNIYKEVRLFVTSDIEKLKESLNPKSNPENKVVDVTGLKVLPEELTLYENQIEPLIVEVQPENATNKHYNVYVPPTLDGITVANVTNNQVRGLNEGKSVVIVYTDQRNAQGEPMVTKNIPITVSAMEHETEIGSSSDKDNHGVNPPKEEQGGSTSSSEAGEKETGKDSTAPTTPPTTSEETTPKVTDSTVSSEPTGKDTGVTSPTTSEETPKSPDSSESTEPTGQPTGSVSTTEEHPKDTVEETHPEEASHEKEETPKVTETSESTEANEHPTDSVLTPDEHSGKVAENEGEVHTEDPSHAEESEAGKADSSVEHKEDTPKETVPPESSTTVTTEVPNAPKENPEQPTVDKIEGTGDQPKTEEEVPTPKADPEPSSDPTHS